MKKYQRLQESKEVASKHIAKIKERGGEVNQSTKDGKILLEYSFPDGKSFIGYRNVKSKDEGEYGTFYNIKKPKFYETKEVTLIFKNPLIVADRDVYNFEGLSLEYLFWKWFPEYDLKSNARKQGVENGELVDKLVTDEAIKRGYDGIIMSDLEIVDLTTHDTF